jgi:hypothetical protein
VFGKLTTLFAYRIKNLDATRSIMWDTNKAGRLREGDERGNKGKRRGWSQELITPLKTSDSHLISAIFFVSPMIPASGKILSKKRILAWSF